MPLGQRYPAAKVRGLRLTVALAAAFILGACGQSEPATDAGPPIIRRLTETQYRNIIADVFGSRISVGGQFDPLVKTGGLYALGASKAGMSPSGLEQFDRRASSLVAQVTS